MVGTFNLREYVHEQRKISQAVMPDYWDGHTHIEAYDAGLNERQAELAVKLTNRMAEKKGLPHETVRPHAISQAANHFNE